MPGAHDPEKPGEDDALLSVELPTLSSKRSYMADSVIRYADVVVETTRRCNTRVVQQGCVGQGIQARRL